MSNYDTLFLTLSAGQMYAGDFEILSEFAKGKEVIVELGTSKGLGSMILSANGGDVCTIDNYSILDEPNEVIDVEGIDKKTWECSLRYYLKHAFGVRTFRADTATTLLKCFYDNTVDLLYIDGDHRFYGVERDYDAWISKVKVGGIILFHDCEEEAHPDVFRFCKMKEEHDDRVEVVEYATDNHTVIKIFRKVK